VLMTVVLATYTPEPLAVPEILPKGFDARVTFDVARARAHLWPAIDPDRTKRRDLPEPAPFRRFGVGSGWLGLAGRGGPTEVVRLDLDSSEPD
jgi:hypothetical protein